MDEKDRRALKDRRRVPRGGRREADQITVQALQRQLEALRIELRTLIAEVKELKDKTE
jgi:fructose-1,6-bisphosphatase/sedoheptulose 1,7-bisphosphatase-like protein